MKNLISKLKKIFSRKTKASDPRAPLPESPDFPQSSQNPPKKSFMKGLFKKKLGANKKSKVAAKDSREKNPANSNKFKLSNLSQKIFSDASRPSIHKNFTFLFILASFYVLGKLSAIIIKGSEPIIVSEKININFKTPPDPKPGILKIQTANLFKATSDLESKPKEQEKKVDENIPCLAADAPSSLPIKLVNSVVLQDSVKSVASVQVRSGDKQTEFREGDKISGMAKVGKIERLRLIFKNLKTGACEFVANQEKGPEKELEVLSPSKGRPLLKQTSLKGIKQDGNNITICKNIIDEKLSNPTTLLSQAKADPFPNPDGTLSFKISQVAPGGIFAHLNIQVDDIITEINGNKINSIQEVLQLFGQINKVDKLNLTVNRGGADVALNYGFEKGPNCQ